MLRQYQVEKLQQTMILRWILLMMGLATVASLCPPGTDMFEGKRCISARESCLSHDKIINLSGSDDVCLPCQGGTYPNIDATRCIEDSQLKSYQEVCPHIEIEYKT